MAGLSPCGRGDEGLFLSQLIGDYRFIHEVIDQLGRHMGAAGLTARTGTEDMGLDMEAGNGTDRQMRTVDTGRAAAVNAHHAGFQRRHGGAEQIGNLALIDIAEGWQAEPVAMGDITDRFQFRQQVAQMVDLDGFADDRALPRYYADPSMR